LNYKIKYNKNVDNHLKEIVDSYWLFSNNKFIFSSHDLSQEYGLKIKGLIEIVKVYSNCVISFKKCTKCKNDFQYTVNTRSHFIFIMNRCNNICDKCNPSLNSLNNIEEYEFYSISSPEYALKNNVWEELSSIELEILKRIVKYKEKHLIYKYVFKNDVFNEDIWNIINHLEDLGLLTIDRESNRKIKSFNYMNELKNRILD